MFNRSRSLVGAMLAAFAGVGSTLAGAIADAARPHDTGLGTPSRHRTRSRPGFGKRGYMLNGERVFWRPAVKFLANVAGMRWEHGQLIPREMGDKPARRKPAKAKATPNLTPRRIVPLSQMAPHEMPRTVARAARRAGVISARQQRKLTKAARRAAKAVAPAPVASPELATA